MSNGDNKILITLTQTAPVKIYGVPVELIKGSELSVSEKDLPQLEAGTLAFSYVNKQPAAAAVQDPSSGETQEDETADELEILLPGVLIEEEQIVGDELKIIVRAATPQDNNAVMADEVKKAVYDRRFKYGMNTAGFGLNGSQMISKQGSRVLRRSFVLRANSFA